MELSPSIFLSAFFYYVSYFFPNEINPDYNVKDTPQNQLSNEYDIVLIGGSTAACVLASRLSEIPSLSILMITDVENENAVSDNPLIFQLDDNTNFTTIPQRKACLAQGGRCKLYSSIRLGGLSALSDMVYVRGNQEDYNQWAREGNTDWSWSKVFPYFLKMENYKIKPLDRSPYHGTKGPMTVRYPRYQTLLRKEYIKAGNEFGWPQNDYNGKTQYGIDYTQFLLDGPTRLSVAQAYLNPIAKRKNLTIIKYSQVTRILLNKRTKTAEGVEYIRNNNTYTVKANREVIISQDTLKSPQLLILSGIGPQQELKRLGIPQICNLPVGRYYQDQPGVDVYFEIDKPFTITTNVWRTNTSVVEFGSHGEGPLTTTGEEAMAFFNALDRKSTSNNAVLRMFSWYPIITNATQNKQIVTARILLQNATSIGSLTLGSKNRNDLPLVNPNFYHEEYDYVAFEGAVKTAIDFMKTPTMMKYSPKVFTGFQPLCKGKNEMDFIKCLIPYYSTGATQGVGTVRMGSVVTQDQLFVRGIKHLRVVDSSVLPSMIKGDPTDATIMLAEKASDIIKNFYGLKSLENSIYPNDYNFTSSASIYSTNNQAYPGNLYSL